MHVAVVALQQHLGNAGGTTEVAVNLEGWMGIEEVGVGAALFLLSAHQGELVANEFQGMVAIEQPGPEAYLPSHAPARGGVATVLERGLCGVSQLGCA